MGGVLDGTPDWFRRLVMPIGFTVVVLVPVLTAWLDMSASVKQLTAQVAAMEQVFTDQQTMNDENHEEFKDAVQDFRIRQAVIVEKIDRILRNLEDD